MRRLFNFLMVAVAVSALFTSCLKEDVPNDYTHIDPIVIIPNANWPKNTATAATAIKVSASPYTVNLYARVSWENALTEAVTVTFVKDLATVAAYNAKFGTSYLAVPDAAISASSLKATIAANTNDASIPVQVNLTLLDPTKTYMLPYAISDAGGQNIGVNYKTYLFPFSLTQ